MKENGHIFPKKISDYLYMSNVYIAVKEKLYFRLKQKIIKLQLVVK
jgi:hypothetical protein